MFKLLLVIVLSLISLPFSFEEPIDIKVMVYKRNSFCVIVQDWTLLCISEIMQDVNTKRFFNSLQLTFILEAFYPLT